jgi:uncharacterized protein
LEEKEIVPLLRSLGCGENVIAHILAVRRLALQIADSVTISVDRELLEKGAVYHDIGRAKTHGIEHAVVGAEMAKNMGLDERVIRIIERHIGAGISRQEAVALGLPERDYIPETPEEKIVAYADNLIDGDRVVSFEEALRRFKLILGEDHPAVERFIKMHKEIENWREGQ